MEKCCLLTSDGAEVTIYAKQIAIKLRRIIAVRVLRSNEVKVTKEDVEFSCMDCAKVV